MSMTVEQLTELNVLMDGDPEAEGVRGITHMINDLWTARQRIGALVVFQEVVDQGSPVVSDEITGIFLRIFKAEMKAAAQEIADLL